LPDRAILRRAQEWKPDLVVVGSHGRSTLGRFVLGSVSLKVLARLHGTVRIARASRRAAGAAARLLVGFDGSAGAEEAVRVVASRRWPVGSEVRVIAVNDPRVLSTVYPLVPQVALANPLQEGDGARWQRTADEAARELQAAGLAAAAFVRAGDPKHLLIDEAIRWGADCIFVGARGLGRFERFLIGSVSTSVAARAHCTVEVVRHLARTSDVWLSANECCLAQGQGGRAYA
jgi:nucleotide-binding universal stress UspA family protein